jgi:hypothetical protein
VIVGNSGILWRIVDMTLEALLLFGNMFTVFMFVQFVHNGTCS